LELRKAGVKIKLEGQPLRILALLIERPGELVTRDDLRKQLWPGNTIVDFEHSINTAMKRLREALGDAAETPRFIETLPRRGYRFLQPVIPIRTTAVPPARPRRYGWQASLLSIGLLLIGSIAVNAFGLRDRLLGRPIAGEVNSIAVLPLKNLSADREQDYFAEGMTESLITQLGKISTLHVISHQSMLEYRGSTKSLPQIARELKVNTVLEGTVLRSENKIRITTNLVQATPERHLWAESFDFDQRDILAVQAQVAREVASKIRVKLTPQELGRLTDLRPVDPEAYEAYLRGRAYLSKTPTAAIRKRAKDYFEKAIEKDPGYAPAYAGMGELYIRYRQWSGEHVAARLQARQWGEKALKLDETLAEAHAILARCAQQDWDWPATEREYRRAIELNPSYALARTWYAMYLYAMLRFDEAVIEAKHAQQVDPLSPLVNTYAGAAYFLAGRVDEAMASWKNVLELDPGYSDASHLLARSHALEGRYDQAIAELEKALIFNKRQPVLLGGLAHAYARAGQRQKALTLVAEMKRIEAEEPGYAPFGMIWAYAGLDDNDQAFAYLEKAYREGAGRMVWINVDPRLEPLRSDPRFQELLRRMKLPTKVRQRMVQESSSHASR
jgi:TolB-like protein/Tfp pilus assembly protein PilF